ncbi:MAG: InlB B-repeat-containing protein [Deltaproteobacteria bacterium]|nr:InlB B-repeat-containing protein [Deltaproteobacteria bacterium]
MEHSVKRLTGWNTALNGSGIAFTAVTNVTSLADPTTKSLTVYAQWTATPGKTVTFNSQGGTAVDQKYVIPVPGTVGVVNWPANPTKPCYTFAGWYKADGVTPFTDSTTVTGDITVYARWTWAPPSTPSTFAIGDPGPSCVGKVFYIDGGGTSGSHGLEMAPPDWYLSEDPSSTGDPSYVWIEGDTRTDEWGSVIQVTQTTLNGKTSTAIGTGYENSNFIIAQTGHQKSAAKLCRDYRGGNLDDWFLPSKDELAQLYAQRDATRWGEFTDMRYWSSSEYDTWDVWSQDFSNGAQTGTLKGYVLPVRPVRAF